MPEYLYKYRDDLYKKVTLYKDPASAPKDICKRRNIAERMLAILPKEDECYAGFERLAAATADGKARCNIRRAARQIEAYALCNPWEWFFTVTLNGKKHDRSDLDSYNEKLVKFICNQRRTYPDISYLLVPELHSDGKNWHMHGLMSGLPSEALRLFTIAEKPPKYIRDKLKQGHLIYEWVSYRDGFGFNDFEPIVSRDRAARYITKYITKDVMQATAKNISDGKHLYYHSRGLILPELILKDESSTGLRPVELPNGFIPVPNGKYEWEYGEVQWYASR